jgi:hypothetical protein
MVVKNMKLPRLILTLVSPILLFSLVSVEPALGASRKKCKKVQLKLLPRLGAPEIEIPTTAAGARPPRIPEMGDPFHIEMLVRFEKTEILEQEIESFLHTGKALRPEDYAKKILEFMKRIHQSASESIYGAVSFAKDKKNWNPDEVIEDLGTKLWTLEALSKDIQNSISEYFKLKKDTLSPKIAAILRTSSEASQMMEYESSLIGSINLHAPLLKLQKKSGVIKDQNHFRRFFKVKEWEEFADPNAGMADWINEIDSLIQSL